VAVPGGHLHVRDQPGASPAIVMMHGFPDDSRIYDRLTPLLAPQRTVAFDWLGYGHSDRTEAKTFTPAEHQTELGTVLDTLAIRRAVLVGHDASGPDAISYAIRHPERVAHLILLNTYYGNAPALRFPEMIQLFADARLTPLADAIVADPAQRLWLLRHSANRFGYETQQSFDPHGIAVTSVVPQFFGGEQQPDALDAIRRWTRALPHTLREHDTTIANHELAQLKVPVTLIFGSRDEYLSPTLAIHLASLFAHSTVQLVGDASHWPQHDQPETVAQLIKETAMRHTSAHEPEEARS
jgi:haloalkane dehalogenase